MILSISLPLRAISVIHDKSFSAPYHPTNRRLNYTKQSGDCSTIYAQLPDCPVTYQASRSHPLRLFAWTQNLLCSHRKKLCYPINNLVKGIPLGY